MFIYFNAVFLCANTAYTAYKKKDVRSLISYIHIYIFDATLNCYFKIKAINLKKITTRIHYIQKYKKSTANPIEAALHTFNLLHSFFMALVNSGNISLVGMERSTFTIVDLNRHIWNVAVLCKFCPFLLHSSLFEQKEKSMKFVEQLVTCTYTSLLWIFKRIQYNWHKWTFKNYPMYLLSLCE